ncbi:pantetheine-phosphate adenylyltransferase [Parabacteroides sp. An277]|uniref:pantetheine-phosphate adenylyltransferase n=1 Tax=Parabacteroides sp. An277 TaxID=1965619 RepID=UPI000B3A3268|nr:pantetheine-phosphate adenylyltransferase [Parabacteroides sp. An277]OUO53909.1 pantetheine-phosphate adenylyltransferase [Parabacteroides sp. An277]
MKTTDKNLHGRIALFPGSFDPFTIGHDSLVKRGLTLADRVVVAVGINEKKQNYFPAEERLAVIRKLYADNPRVEVRSYQTLTTDLAHEVEADFILRGIRSVIDFEYEKTIADVNRTLTGIETVFLLAEPQYAHISSSAVRELLFFGKEVSAFLPERMKIEGTHIFLT